ncbi:MAG: hypothetical protein J07HX64_02241 [halophilic archaeon J07HX64]|nr:MAG: hypothetical protein J07HX64_02241 [halophilic archaeon J07HX64]
MSLVCRLAAHQLVETHAGNGRRRCVHPALAPNTLSSPSGSHRYRVIPDSHTIPHKKRVTTEIPGGLGLSDRVDTDASNDEPVNNRSRPTEETLAAGGGLC